MIPVAETLSTELLDVVDSADQVVDVRSRGEIHRERLMHRSVHVLVFNAGGELLLQKRSMLKDECRGMWDSSCAGHVEAGQTYHETAPRELSEELGLSLDTALEPLFKMPATEVNGLEFAMVYRTIHNGPFVFAEDEIDAIKWFDFAHVDQWVAETVSATDTSSRTLTSGFCEIWNRYRQTDVRNP